MQQQTAAAHKIAKGQLTHSEKRVLLHCCDVCFVCHLHALRRRIATGFRIPIDVYRYLAGDSSAAIKRNQQLAKLTGADTQPRRIPAAACLSGGGLRLRRRPAACGGLREEAVGGGGRRSLVTAGDNGCADLTSAARSRSRWQRRSERCRRQTEWCRARGDQTPGPGGMSRTGGQCSRNRSQCGNRAAACQPQRLPGTRR